ncbi:MAG TPA: hypothetical protein VIK78_10565 [Ruminiclostridium sp.]
MKLYISTIKYELKINLRFLKEKLFTNVSNKIINYNTWYNIIMF